MPGKPALTCTSGNESGFRADTVHDKTPVIQRPGQRQSISAASAVNAKGGFWFATYEGALNAELFIELLKKLMKRRARPVHLVVDGPPAHKKANRGARVRQFSAPGFAHPQWNQSFSDVI
jgi:DDE superfamily endonuclease